MIMASTPDTLPQNSMYPLLLLFVLLTIIVVIITIEGDM